MEEIVDLAIVGGGSTATSFLAQLIETLDKSGIHGSRRIVVFEPLPDVGPGEPYAEDLPTNLLNIPAGKMSAYAGDRGHFLKWVESQGDAILQKYGVNHLDAGTFLPRPMFGEYLKEVWQDLCANAKILGVNVQQVAVRVDGIALSPENSCVHLETRKGVYGASRVVLCNGNLPSASYTDLQGCKGYFNSPYPVTKLAALVEREASVGIIGTSLSAIDAIVALVESGHAGPLLSVSRSGRLPSVRSAVAPSTPIVPPTAEEIASLVQSEDRGLTLEALFSLLSERLTASGDALDWTDVLGYGSDPQTALEREIDASSTLPRNWQSIAISLNDSIEHAWRLMPDSEKRSFYAKWRSLWMTRRATFPLTNALKIKQYLNEDRLQIQAGSNDLAIQPAGDGFEITFSGANGSRHRRHVDYIVNATGMSTNVAASNDPLVQSLLKREIASANPYGGFNLDFDTGCLLYTDGSVIRNISVLGSLAVGTYFWTMSLDVNARLALDQAKRIANELTTCAPPHAGSEPLPNATNLCASNIA
ncbi:FAD/NAD(P)-binding protein [Alcaligenaceae bacterium]|nr:FAD/NAD(P)-binding protein [Alcaligenaceae bacterium]